MIARVHRFHGYGSLRGVYSRGQTVRSPLISLKYSTRSGNRPYRSAVVVSRKVNKSAVVRNRIRRRVYEIVRLMGVGLPDGLDLVFTAFSDELATIPPEALQEIVTGLVHKAATNPSTSILRDQGGRPRGIVNAKGKLS
jgi:ribonuclease P protein component